MTDMMLIDMDKPHLYPPNMPLYRIPYYANGGNVDTVIVDGRVLMAGRVVATVDEAALLAAARETELAAMLEIAIEFGAPPNTHPRA